MARVFTTIFSYNGMTYTAVISQVNGSLSIYVPDESLHFLLPKGRILLHPDMGLKVDPQKLTPAQNLVLTILSAVELNHSPAATMERD